MEVFVRVVLSHYPCRGHSNLRLLVFGSSYDVGVELLHRCISIDDPISQLSERVLNIARLILIVKVIIHLGIGQRPAKPSPVPGNKRYDYKKSDDYENGPGVLTAWTSVWRRKNIVAILNWILNWIFGHDQIVT